MRSRDIYALVAVIALVLVALGAGVAVAAGGGGDATVASETMSGEGAAGDDDGKTDDGDEGNDEADGSLTGDAAAKASEAALAATGGGTVLAVEIDDGGSGYEVEIRTEDGSEVEVELSRDFEVVTRAEDD